LQRARTALADTPKQMALLQKAGVVDAGARGFVDWLEGIAEYVDGGPRAVRLHGHARRGGQRRGRCRRTCTRTWIPRIAGARSAW
jgi:dihydroxyacetone kinase-like predicted kinase